MASQQQENKPPDGNSSKGPGKIIVLGDFTQMATAAESDPALAKLLKKTPNSGWQEQEKADAEPEDLTKTIKEWESVMRHEAGKRTGVPGDGSSWLDNFSMLQIGGGDNPKTGSGVRFESLQERDEAKAQDEAKKWTEQKENGKESKINDDSSTPKQGGSSSRSYSHKIPDQEWMKNLAAIGQEKEPTSKIAEVQGPTSAELLLEALIADKFPTHPVVRDDFGFNKVSNQEEETCMLGLYQGLMIGLPNPPSVETLQGWVNKDKLAGGIYHSYKSRDQESGYFNWFKKNQHFFDRDYVNPKGPRVVLEPNPRIDTAKFNKIVKGWR